MTAKDKQVF